MYHYHHLTIVIPVHNEAELLPSVVASLPDFVDHVVFVDDASTDDTLIVLRHLAESQPGRFTVLRHLQNQGVGAATITGYRHALANKADLIVLMDGDGQMDSRDLPVMLDTLIGGPFDFVKGNRFAHPSINHMPWTRYLGNYILSWLTRLALGCKQPVDAQCGFTVFRATGLRQLDLNQLFPRYGFPNDLLFEVAAKGLYFTSVPVRTIYGNEISGINPFVVLPTILGLIARGYWRRLGRQSSKPRAQWSETRASQ